MGVQYYFHNDMLIR